MAVLGYGIGGYGGQEEPWGSIEFPLPSGLNRDASSTDFLGIIEATSGIIGEADSELGGFRSTRLTSVANISDTTINVESTLNWESSGKVSIDGVVYYYINKTETSLIGISYIQNGSSVVGIGKLHNIESEVVDLNGNYSYLDKLRRALLVDYAEGEDLRVIGRDLGVPYIALFGDDDTYREVIKSVAYSPRGTVYGIELALDAIIGSGLYEIYEDLIERPCEVIIKLDDAYLIDDNPYGKAYFNEVLYGVISGSFDDIVVSYEPTSVASVKLKGLSELFDFRSETPSASQYLYYEGGPTSTAFTYSGSLAEGSAITNVSGLYTNFDLTTAPNTAYYTMLDTQGARIDNNSIVVLDTVISIPSTSTLTSGKLEQISFAIGDGSYRVSLGVDVGYVLGLFNTEVGGFLGTTYTLTADQFYNIKIVKNKEEYVELYVDGLLVTKESYFSFTNAYSSHDIAFGLRGTPALNTELNIKQLAMHIYDNRDVWSSYFYGIGFTNSANPNRFSITGTHSFLPTDVGDYLEIKDATALNAYGGNNNGKYTISTYLSSTSVTLSGISREGATIESGTPPKLIVPKSQSPFKYPDDLGKRIEITGSSLGNNGFYYITSLLQCGTLIDFSTFSTPNIEYTHTCTLSGGALTSETGLNYTIVPDFITDTTLGLIHSGTGSISSTTLTLKDSLWKNGLVMEVAATNAYSMQLLYDEFVSNNVISTAPLAYEYYPFYLFDKSEALDSYMDDLTIAGVIPKIGNR